MTIESSEIEKIKREFPPFSLSRLLKTVFQPEPGEKICILIDFADPHEIEGFRFLENSGYEVQIRAHKHFFQGLKNGVLGELQLQGGDIFAYQSTGGSNLDLPDLAITPDGREISLEKDVYSKYDIVLCISTDSATAPLTAHAKKVGFRGATLHGINDIILSSGLAVDYEQVSKEAEKMRRGMTRADRVIINFEMGEQSCQLTLELDKQEAQKSHGLCRGKAADVANLPAGEIYYVPKSAQGDFPLQYDDGSIGRMEVNDGRIQKAVLLIGHQETIDQHNAKLESDPVTGEIGELGFGTQVLPPSGKDIQDEKILGTLHVATGRSDHLGGHLTPDLFQEKMNATHDDILFSPTKTPSIYVPKAVMIKDGEEKVLIENYQPVYMRTLLDS